MMRQELEEIPNRFVFRMCLDAMFFGFGMIVIGFNDGKLIIHHRTKKLH